MPAQPSIAPAFSGYWMALSILTINLAGDTAIALIAHDLRTGIGLPIGGAMIVYLLTKWSAFP